MTIRTARLVPRVRAPLQATVATRERQAEAPAERVRVAALAKSTADAPSFDLPDLADDERAELIERSLQLPPRHQQPTNVFEMVAAG